MLIISTIITLVIVFVRQFQKVGKVSFETGGEIVEYQIVSFARASGRGVDLEHGGV
jgi:hypothetical protein